MSAKLGVSLPNVKNIFIYIYVFNCIFHAKVCCGILPYDGNDMKSEDSYICAENAFHKKEKLIENWPLLESRRNVKVWV